MSEEDKDRAGTTDPSFSLDLQDQDLLEVNPYEGGQWSEELIELGSHASSAWHEIDEQSFSDSVSTDVESDRLKDHPNAEPTDDVDKEDRVALLRVFNEGEEEEADAFCCFTSIVDEEYDIELAATMHDSCVGVNLNLMNFSCFIETFIDMSNCVLMHSDHLYSDSLGKDQKTCFYKALSDAIKFRHDLFFSCFLLAIESNIGNVVFGTDMSFEDYGINSKRTPDYILRKGDTVFVIECSVTSDMKKSSFQKGVSKESSKYKVEISDLEKKFDVVWMPVFLSTKNMEHNVKSCFKILDKFEVPYNESNFQRSFSEYCERCKNFKLLDHLSYLVLSDPHDDVLSEENVAVFKQCEKEMKSIGYRQEKPESCSHVMVNKSIYERFYYGGSGIVTSLMSKDFSTKLSYVEDMGKRKYYFLKSNAGLLPHVWIDKIEKKKLNFLFRYCKCKNDEGLHEALGYHPCVVHRESVLKDVNDCNHHDHSRNPQKKDCSYTGAMIQPYYLSRGDYTDSELDVDVENEEKYINATKKKLLCDYKVNVNMIEMARLAMVMEQESQDSTVEINLPKQSFLLPIFNPDNSMIKLISDQDTSFEEKVADMIRDTDLKCIIGKIAKKDFRTKVVISDELKQKESELAKKYVIAAREIGIDKIPGMRKSTYDDTYPELKAIALSHKDVQKQISLAVRKGKLKVRSTTIVKYHTFLTKGHFLDKTERHLIRGMKDDYSKDAERLCQDVMGFMSGNCIDGFATRSFDKLMDFESDTKEMNALKKVTMKNHVDALEGFCNLRVRYMADFISNLCYTLTHFSQTPLSKVEYEFSNLTRKDVILIVKGGQRVYKTKNSRLFSLVYPTTEFMYETRCKNESFEYFVIEGKYYCMQKWNIFTEKILCDMMTCVQKCASTYCNFMSRNVSYGVNVNNKNIWYNFLIMFNNRRGTEEMHANLRYIMMNSLGDRSAINEITPSMSKVCHDAVQRFFIDRLCKNYTRFALGMRDDMSAKTYDKMIHPITEERIMNENELMFLLYSPHCMTKAPYSQISEQTRNLKSVMEGHQDYYDSSSLDYKEKRTMLTETEDFDLKSPGGIESVFENDFCFNSRYCERVGKRASSYMKGLGKVPELHSTWESILEKQWTIITTASGMRGNDFIKGSEAFFGRKGHEVTMQDLLREITPDEIESLMDLNKSAETLAQKVRELTKLNVTIAKKIRKKKGKFKFVFHIVDKSQWKGNREIFVMTLDTKLFQQPLEMFFRKLCELTDTELISIPSDKRLKRLHAQVFEKLKVHEHMIKFFFNFDCKRWAPKAMFLKYVHFVLGMSDILPFEFVRMFLVLAGQYYEKEVVVSQGAWKSFINNAGNKKYEKYFTTPGDLDTGSFVMPYSFVMGIFNYLSSLFHAFNQMEAIDNIKRRAKKKFGVDIEMVMKAHSDDSGGYCMFTPSSKYKTEDVLDFVLKNYEIELKFCNHMLSAKKCVVSTIYSEILSILYVNGKLLPLIPKFVSNVRFTPSMKGYSSDQALSYGKCTEILENGGTFAEAYFNMRIFSEIVRDFYKMPYMPDRPLSALGCPNSHPIMVFLVGSFADDSRLYRVNRESYIKFQSISRFLSGVDFTNVKVSPFSDSYQVNLRWALQEVKKKIETLYKPLEDLLEDEMFSRVDVQHTLIKPICFYHKLKDKSFLASLSYESNVRMLCRLISTAGSRNKDTILGLRTLREINDMINLFYYMDEEPHKTEDKMILDCMKQYEEDKDYNFYSLVSKTLLKDSLCLYDYIDDCVGENFFIENSTMTCKPITVSLQVESSLLDINTPLEKLFYSEHENFFMLLPRMDVTEEKKLVHDMLSDLAVDPSNYSNYVIFGRKILKYSNVYKELYGVVSSANRTMENYFELFSYLETNSIFGRKITKIFNKAIAKYKGIRLADTHDPTTLREMQTIKFYSFCRRNKHNLETIKFKDSGRKLIDLPDMIKDFRSVVKSIGEVEIKMCEAESNSESVQVILGTDPGQINSRMLQGVVWLKKQFRDSDSWRGVGKLLVYAHNTMIEVHILDKNVVKVCIEEEKLDNLRTSSLEVFKFVFFFFKIGYSTQISMRQEDVYYYGYDDQSVKVSPASELSHVFFPVETVSKLTNCMRQGTILKSTNKSGVYQIDNTPYKFSSLVSLIPTRFSDINDIFEVSSEEEQGLILNLLSHEKDFKGVDLSLDMSFILSDLSRTFSYDALMENKLNNRNTVYILKDMIKDYCKGQNIYYNDFLKATLQEIFDLNLNIKSLPDEVVNILSEQIQNEFLKRNKEDIVKDLVILARHKTEEMNWTNFISKWGHASAKSVLATTDIKLPELVNHPLMLPYFYPSLSEIVLDELLKSLGKMMNAGLANELRENENGIFLQINSITRGDWDVMLMQNYYSVSSLNRQPTALLYLANHIFAVISKDVTLTKMFRGCLSECTSVLKNMPFNTQDYKDWAALLSCSSMSKDRFKFRSIAPKEHFQLVRDLTSLKSEKIPLKLFGPMDKNLGFGTLKVSESTDMYTKKGHVYRALFYEKSKTKDAKLLPFTELGGWADIKKYLSKNPDEEDDFEEIMDEVCMDYEWKKGQKGFLDDLVDWIDEREIKKNYKIKSSLTRVIVKDENKALKYARRLDKKGRLKLTEFACPVYRVCGSYYINQFLWDEPFFAVHSDTLPIDLELMNNREFKLYVSSSKSINFSYFVCLYNVPYNYQLDSDHHRSMSIIQAIKLRDDVRNPLMSMYMDNTVVKVKKGEEYKVFDCMNQISAELTTRLSSSAKEAKEREEGTTSSDEDRSNNRNNDPHDSSSSDDTYDYSTFAHSGRRVKEGTEKDKKNLTKKQTIASRARTRSEIKKEKKAERIDLMKMVNFEKNSSVEHDEDIDKPERMTLRLATYACKKYKKYVDSFGGSSESEGEDEDDKIISARKDNLKKFFNILSRRVYKLEDLELLLDVMKGMGVTLKFLEVKVKDCYPLNLDMRDILRFIMCNSKALSDSLIRNIMTSLFPVDLLKEMETVLEQLITFDRDLKSGMDEGMEALTFQDSIKGSEMFRNFMGNYEKMSDKDTNDFCPLKPNEVLFLELKAMFGEHVTHMITRRPQLTRRHKLDLKNKLHGLPRSIERMTEQSDRVKATLLKEMLSRIIKYSQQVEKYDRGDYHYKCLNHFYDRLIEAVENFSDEKDDDEDDDQNYKVEMIMSSGSKVTIAELLSDEERLRMLT